MRIFGGFSRSTAEILDTYTTIVGRNWVPILDTTEGRWRIFDGLTPGGIKMARLDEVALTPVFSTKTSNYSVLDTDNFTNFNNIGAVGTVVFSLLPAAANLSYTFVVFASQILRIDAAGGDLIKGGTTFSSGDIESNQPYSSITLQSHGSGLWVTTSTVGNWS